VSARVTVGAMRSVLLVLLIGCGGGNAPVAKGGGGDLPPPTGPTNVDCRLRIGLRCPDGRVDGCNSGKTLVHICIPEGEQPGPPCSQEIAKQCPSGQTDACLKAPPVATTHLCVF
jgi:hypothetical protein